MAFNLGDKFEIHSLRLDVVELQKQVKLLLNNIPTESVKFFHSWKYPATCAIEMDVTDLLQNHQYDEDDVEKSKTSHVTLLELTLDRLIFFLQVVSVIIQDIRTSACSEGKAATEKRSAGLVAKNFVRVLDKSLLNTETRKQELREKWNSTGEQTDDLEIKVRNLCVPCCEKTAFLNSAFDSISKAFQNNDENPEALSRENSFAGLLTELEEDCKNLCTFKSETSCLLEKCRSLQDEIKSAEPTLRTSEAKNTRQERNNVEQLSVVGNLQLQQEDMEKEISSATRDVCAMKEKHSEILARNLDAEWQLSKKKKEAASLENALSELREKQIDFQDASTTAQLERDWNQNELTGKLREAENELRKFDGFDRNWMAVLLLTQDQTASLRSEVDDLQREIHQQTKGMRAKTEQLEHLKIQNTLKSELLEKNRQERARLLEETLIQLDTDLAVQPECDESPESTEIHTYPDSEGEDFAETADESADDDYAEWLANFSTVPKSTEKPPTNETVPSSLDEELQAVFEAFLEESEANGDFHLNHVPDFGISDESPSLEKLRILPASKTKRILPFHTVKSGSRIRRRPDSSQNSTNFSGNAPEQRSLFGHTIRSLKESLRVQSQYSRHVTKSSSALTSPACKK